MAVPLAILTVAGSKLVYYALPLAPPFAVLALGELRRLAQEAPRPRPRLGVALLVLGGAVAFAGALALVGSLVEPEALQAWVGRQRSPAKLAEELQRLRAVCAALPVVGVAALAVGIGLGWSGRALRAGRPALALSGVAGCLLLANLAVPWVLREAGAAYSDRDLARAVAAHAGEHGAVVGYGTFRRGVPFYLDRPCYVWYATYAEFGHDLARGECRYALQNDEQALAALIAAEPRIVLIARNVQGGEALAALSPVPLRLLTTVGGRALFVRADAR
ncbi:MAG: hypothetical protein R3F62_22800 [Planctomycetota bacterium]